MMKKLVVLTTSYLLLTTCYADAQERKAIFSFLKGTIKVVNKGKSEAAKLGMEVLEGQEIISEADAKAELKFDDGSILRVGSNSKLTIKALKSQPEKSATIAASVGRLWFNAREKKSKFQIETPSAIAAVKGTVYRADVDEKGETQVNVYDGEVVVQTPDGKDTTPLKRLDKLATEKEKPFAKDTFDEVEEEQKDEWVKWNRNRDKLRVMVIFYEKMKGEKDKAVLAENIIMQQFINNYLFQVIEKEQVDEIREQEKVKAALKRQDAAGIAAAGLLVAADLVVTGLVQIDSEKIVIMNVEGYTGTADMSARVVRADTAEVLGTTGDIPTARARDVTATAAATNAIRKSAEPASKSLIETIIKKWKWEAQKGATIDIMVSGVTDHKFTNALKEGLAGIDGVKNVQTLYFVAERALLNVNFVGDSIALVSNIEKAEFKGIKVSVVGYSAYRIELEIKP